MTSPIPAPDLATGSTKRSAGTAKDRGPRWSRPRAFSLCLGIVTLCTFLPAVRCGFVNFDDEEYVLHPLVVAGLSTDGVRRACTEVVFHNWAPLTVISYEIDASLFGAGPWGFHLTSVLIHAITATVLYVALARMTAEPFKAFAATLLFAVHPLRVESVVWVAERKDVLSMLFLGLAVLAYESFCRRPSVARYLPVVAAMIGGLLSKATVVALPALLLVLDVWPMGRVRLPGMAAPGRGAGEPSPYPGSSWPAVLIEKLPLLALSALFVAITIATQSETIHAEEKTPLLSSRIPNALVAAATYLAETAVPVGLHPAHPHPGPGGIPVGLVLASVLGLVSLMTVAVIVGRQVPAVMAGVAWFVIALSPVLGIVKQHGFQAHADRFTYLAHVGLMVAIVWGFARLAELLRLPRAWSTAAVAAVAFLFIAIDQRQIGMWKDSESLWSHTLSIDPDNHVATAKLAVKRLERGDLAAAERGFRQTLSLAPDFPESHYNLGVTLLRQQRHQEAVGEFLAAVRSNPRDAAAHGNLGGCYAHLGRWAEAVEELRTATQLDDSLVSARLNLGFGLLREHDVAGALEQAAAVAARQPANVAAWLLLGRCAMLLGDAARAREAYASAVEADPRNLRARANLAAASMAAGDSAGRIALANLVAADPTWPTRFAESAAALAGPAPSETPQGSPDGPLARELAELALAADPANVSFFQTLLRALLADGHRDTIPAVTESAAAQASPIDPEAAAQMRELGRQVHEP